jgi:superfamily II DNA or RNA helicase
LCDALFTTSLLNPCHVWKRPLEKSTCRLLARTASLELMQVPRPHQSKAIDFAIEQLKQQGARCLVQLPTGSGKSLVKAHVAKHWFDKGRRVVVLTPSAVTVGKLFWELRRIGLLPEIDMGSKKAASGSEVVIGTYATAWRDQDKHFDPTALLILDECHHCNEKAKCNTSIYRQYNYVFGVSASPWSDACLKLFKHHHFYPLRQAIKDGINCEFEILDDCAIGANKYQLVYCPTSHTAKQIGRSHPGGDWVLYDADHKNERIVSFREGKISTMFVNRMLTEGFDLPPVKHIWIQRDTRSPVLAYQMLGRALRPYDGQIAKCYVRHPETKTTLQTALAYAGY